MVKDPCDVLILSASYGGGHNQVARALTEALQLQAPDLKVQTVNFCDLLVPLVSRLSRFGYLQVLRHFRVGYALYYQATGNMAPDSFWQRHLNRMGCAELTSLVGRLQPRVIISTFPLPAGVLSHLKESGLIDQPLVTAITDITVHSQWIHPQTDLYIVGSEEVAVGLNGRGVPRERIAATGIPILPAFNQLQLQGPVRAKYQLKPTDKVIIFMGGSDGMFGTTRFSQILAGLNENVKAFVITGSNHELYEKLAFSNGRQDNLQILSYVDNVAELMGIADVLVSKAGGITISEALAIGLPMIIYKPAPGQEEGNANYLWRHRAAIIAKGERRLRSAIFRMVHDENFRLRFQRNCLKIGNPASAEASAREILKLITPTTRYTTFLPSANWRVEKGYLNEVTPV